MIDKIIFKENSRIRNLLKYEELTLNKITLLVGSNGSGKSSILYGLATHKPRMEHQHGAYYRECGEGIELVGDTPKENILCFSARTDNGKYRGYFDDDMATDLQSLFMSEGQSVRNSFTSFVVKKLAPLIAKDEPILFLIDELDSGVTHDNIMELCKLIVGLSAKVPKLQIVMTTNNFDFMFMLGDKEANNIVKVPTGERINVESYGDFVKIYYRKDIK